jgi:putative oxidoreductase
MFHALAVNTLAPLVLRLGLAAIFIFHGIEKVGAGGGTAWHPVPDYSSIVQVLVAWGELLGGLACLLGLLTRLAAVGLAFIMIGAIATVHGEKGFALKDGGFEYNFAILVICAAVILLGPGNLALDRFVRLKRKTSA